MKFWVACALFFAVEANVLPDRVTKFLCLKNDPQYEKCVKTALEESVSEFRKGIPELNLPPIDPLELPIVKVDRTVNELVSINAILKNVRVVGASNFIIEDLKANPVNLTGEARVTFPWTSMEMDYDVNGQLLIIPLRSKGYFSGNFTDTKLFVKGHLKTEDKNGEKFFKVDKFFLKSRVGDGRVRLLSENPSLQFGADLIANFYNENPRRVMDAINPIFVETAQELYRVILDQIFSTVPAKEWLPE